MNFRSLSFLLLLFFINSGLYSQFVTEQTALKVEENIYQQIHQNPFSVSMNPEIEIVNDKNNLPAYYIFKYEANNGFVVVAADERVIPLLAYSPKGSWENERPCPAHQSWMNNYITQIEDVRFNNIQATAEIKSQWSSFASDDQPVMENLMAIVGPFTDDITWDQNCLYNEDCPADAAGPCGHVYAGCVATCMSILMKYHHHPNTGTGSYSYTHAVYGTQSANFGATNYSFAEMPNFIADDNVAQLMYQAAVSVDMDFGPAGSAAFTGTAISSLVSYFNFSSSAYYDYRSNHTDPVWEGMVKTELDNNRPLIYRGQGTGGHAFVFESRASAGSTREGP